MAQEYVAIKVDNTSDTATKQQANTGHDQPLGGTGSNVQDDVPLSPTEKNFLEEIKPERAGGTSSSKKQKSQHTKIQQVPEMLRREPFSKYFQPRAIAIGPLHRNSKTLFDEDLKKKLAAEFVKKMEHDKSPEESNQAKSSKEGDQAESLYRIIKKNIEHLKTYFDEKVIKSYNDESLAIMLFSDGCSIMQFIYSCARGDLKLFNINNGQAALIQQDLFLLENQIPYKVLKLLMKNSSSHKPEDLEESIKAFIRMNVMSPAKYSENIELDLGTETKEPVHLLDLLRSALLQEDNSDHHHIYGHHHNHDHKKDFSKCQVEYKRTFRNIQDLKAAGIKVEPSDTCSLRDVSFSALCFAGYLKLPPLIVDDSTGRKLLNLVAYEMCPDKFQTEDGVTSYVYFLDSLIDNEEDAKDLRMATIFRNRLSSDAEVAKMFNEIGTDLVPAPGYVDVKIKIQKHYDNRCMTWVAQVYRDHFSSPWTILALTAAVIVLVLTGVQTWFAVLPR
ncbi:hypothetical protein TorRG33x02_282530 [Trema orientale]|uniref:Uncharacterized protein n=1 Tax=Trema orientale TaxID=63057 RepID=A0A2P5CJL2_TREOI|nr:hypothetical protein TorRG33x02_282530 [Trema orientale]